MSVSLVSILKEVLTTNGNDLDQARKDLKTLRRNLGGIKISRSIISKELRELKSQCLIADRNGGGSKSSELVGRIKFLRAALNDMTEESVMIRIQSRQCASYIKAQHEKVIAIDAEYEKARALETDNKTKNEQV